MERFFGGSPWQVIIKLAILSIVVGVALRALGYSPLELIQSIDRLIDWIANFSIEWIDLIFRYFLLGAVIVVPVWVVFRLLKLTIGAHGRRDSDAPRPPVERDRR